MTLPDGKISVIGSTRFNFLISRFNIDGSFDTTFNGNGKLSIHLGPIGSYDNATAVALQGGHVIVGGNSSYNTSNSSSGSQLVLRLLDTIHGLRLVITPRSTLTPCAGGRTRLVVNETGTIQWFNDGSAIPGAYDTVYTADQSGNYYVTVQNAKGCGESDPVHVLFNGLPIVITPSGSLNICEGDSVVLTANQSDNLQWYRDHIIIPGATNASFIAKSSGSYFVSVQNANGCGGSAPLDVTLNPVKPSISWGPVVMERTRLIFRP
jgi:hypothetical protein